MNKIASHLDFHAQALMLRSRRNEILASNIANAATPNFKARDLSFDDQIKKHAPDVGILPKLSLKKLAFLISQFDLVIGPDTGPTHIAWALNIPSIALYGPTPGYRNSLETEFNKIIESESNVNPNKIDKNDYSIKNIEVENIVSKARELLTLGN